MCKGRKHLQNLHTPTQMRVYTYDNNLQTHVYVLLHRVNENLETSLIQEKFEDWSNISRELGKEVLQQTSRGEIVEKANKPVTCPPTYTIPASLCCSYVKYV